MQRTRTFGEQMRERREARGFSMRGLAEDVEVSASYICDIENDRRTPSEPVMARLAATLNWDFEEACASAAVLGKSATHFLRQRPGAVRLLRRCAEFDLNDSTMVMMADMIESA